MRAYRLSPTTSRRHWSLVKRLARKYATQQKARERALECLDSSSLISSLPTKEEKAWLLLAKEARPLMVIMPKEQCKLWAETADMDRYQDFVDKFRPIEFSI